MAEAAAGEDDIGADASSIDRKVTTEPEKKNQYAIRREARQLINLRQLLRCHEEY